MPYRWTNYPYPHYHYYTGYYGPYYGQTQRTDQDIRDDVKEALALDTWVNANNVQVEAHNGVVTLTGTVSSITEKRAAGDDAWDTPGVLDVHNNLQIQR